MEIQTLLEKTYFIPNLHKLHNLNILINFYLAFLRKVLSKGH
jgi:hypothetical protein